MLTPRRHNVIIAAGVVAMARPVSRADHERARLTVWLPGVLKGRLARAAFDGGTSVSALIERAVERALDERSQPTTYEVPRARWVRMTETDWSVAVSCAAAPGGEVLLHVEHLADGGWRWRVDALRGQMLGTTRTWTAALLDAEDAAARGGELTVPKPSRRRGG